eukprot:1146079-Pelagomonas_calceolata.AAC.3
MTPFRGKRRADLRTHGVPMHDLLCKQAQGKEGQCQGAEGCPRLQPRVSPLCVCACVCTCVHATVHTCARGQYCSHWDDKPLAPAHSTVHTLQERANECLHLCTGTVLNSHSCASSTAYEAPARPHCVWVSSWPACAAAAECCETPKLSGCTRSFNANIVVDSLAGRHQPDTRGSDL